MEKFIIIIIIIIIIIMRGGTKQQVDNIYTRGCTGHTEKELGGGKQA